jgi:hypothetical protein
MRFRGRTTSMAAAACLALAALAPAGPAGAATPAPGWQATEIYGVAPGLSGPHSEGLLYDLNAVSCAGAGSCVAAGAYPRRHGHGARPMAATETGGAWAPARRIWLPATRGDPDGDAQVYALSCPSPRWCAAGGVLGGSNAGNGRAFVITESDGTWNRLHLVRLPRNGQVYGEVYGLSCPRPRSCVAVGNYATNYPGGGSQPMAVTDVAGRWQAATEVAAPRSAYAAAFSSVACPTATTCVAVGGQLAADSSLPLPLADTFTGGRWHSDHLPSARELTGLYAVGCQSAGRCLAWGSDTGLQGDLYTVLDQGRWTAPAVLKDLPPGGSDPDMTSVSCTPRACLSGGDYYAPTGLQAFVVTLAAGRWLDPAPIRPPGNAQSGDPLTQITELTGLSCATGAACTAVGVYTTRQNAYRGWAATGPLSTGG